MLIETEEHKTGEINIIADIAGEFDALMELVGKMPRAPFVLLGDLNDRGPKSKEVIEWAMQTPDVTTLHSNHGELFVDFYRMQCDENYESTYWPTDFINNGGLHTLYSYGFGSDPNHTYTFEDIPKLIPKAHIDWLDTRPLYFEGEGIFCSHAPLHEHLSLDKAIVLAGSNQASLLWNRGYPKKRDAFQVFGHNSHWGVKAFDDWAYCLDGSRQRVLTGMHWPSRQLYQVSYDGNNLWTEKRSCYYLKN